MIRFCCWKLYMRLFSQMRLTILLELTLGITSVEAGFQTQLIEASPVGPPRRQFRIRKIQKDVFLLRQAPLSTSRVS